MTSSGRLEELIKSIPPTTLGIMALCIGLFVLECLLDWDLTDWTMSPQKVLYRGEVYRIVTAPLLHATWMHIAFNMFSTYAMGSMLEKQQLGTIYLAMTIGGAILWTSALYLLLAWLAFVVVGYRKWMYEHAIGFSGVIFHLSVLECYHHRINRSFFGIIQVPSYLYPWVLLVGLQFFMPNLSFLGHLAGILTGTLQHYGVLNCCLPSDSYLTEMESWNSLQWLVRMPNFVSKPSSSMDGHRLGSWSSSSSSSSSLRASIQQGFHKVMTIIRNGLDRIYVAIFGRGDRLNSNIRLGSTSTGSASASPSSPSSPSTWPEGGRVLGTAAASSSSSTTPTSSHRPVEDDDDWAGLPDPERSEKVPLSRLV